MTCVLLLVLFVLICWVGHLITGVRQERLSCSEDKDTFTINYGKRIIHVIADDKIRLCSYKRKKNIESVTFPGNRGMEGMKQVEHFVSRYRTSKLVKHLFAFEQMREPLGLIHFDPFNAKELAQIQMKLKSFVRHR